MIHEGCEGTLESKKKIGQRITSLFYKANTHIHYSKKNKLSNISGKRERECSFDSFFLLREAQKYLLVNIP
jgi:hypothetical protein